MIRSVFAEDEQLGEYVAAQIGALLETRPDALICIAAGTSSLPIFAALIRWVEDGRLSFERASFMAMDEWLHFGQDQDGSMADFLNKHFLGQVDFAEIFLFDGLTSDPVAECARAEAFIADHGGIDYLIFGIGMNGHIALNEPGSEVDSRTRVVKVDSVTAQVGQKYFKQEAKLTEGITLGVANALETRQVVLVANTASKAAILRRFERESPNAALPATYLKLKEDMELLLTEAAAN